MIVQQQGKTIFRSLPKVVVHQTQLRRGPTQSRIAENLLRKWKKALDAQDGQAFPGKGNRPTLEEELRRLRAENKRLQMERDILKKATAFFAKESL
ncbi:MAG TPA: hypothetical protein VN688_00480 [Gemmataceae bacterium]|nr:hypothetical protein [Gemmataceae bacterium]